MAITPQSLFSWQDIEASSDIARFRRLLGALGDEALIEALEAARKGRRNDYPVAAVWNSLIAALVFGHDSVASLRRELRRNGELREACGFDPLLGERAVPTKDAYSRFLAKLPDYVDRILAIFHRLVERLMVLLPDLGQNLAADGKAIVAWRKSDTDADEGRKETAEKTMTWLGYKLHMLCDARYELPLAFRVTPASAHESPHLLGLVQEAKTRHPDLIERAETLAADKGYDDGADKAELFDEHAIAPLIPARDCHDGRYEPLDPHRSDTIYLSPTGQVACKIAPFDPDPDKAFAPMQFQGFEPRRATLKFRCPAAYGLVCHNQAACRALAPDQGFGRVLRVPLERDRRRLLPIHQHSYRFQRLYKGRTGVERLFARLDHLYGFEHHTTVGLKKMHVRMAMALIAMLATALAHIQAGQQDHLRRRLQAA